MNKEEMGLFNDLWHIGTDMMAWDYQKPADKLKEKIIKTFEKNKQLHQTLLDIKEYIEKYGTGKGMGEEWFETSTPVTYLKNIVNKALRSDPNE